MEKRRDPLTTKRKFKIALPLFIQKSSVYRYVFARKRRATNSKTPNTSNSRRIKISFKPVLVILAVIFFALLVFNISKYFAFNPQKMGESEISSVMNYDNYSVLFIGLDDRVSGYEFAKIATIVDFDINGNVAKLYTINPSFLTKKSQGYPIKTLWNNFSKSSQAEDFMKEIESFLAINIDNYIVFKRGDFESMYSNAFKVTARSDYAIGAKVVKKGESIDVDKSLSLVMDESNLSDDSLYFQQDFVKAYLEMFKSRLYSYSVFLNSERFLATVKTGLNRNDYLGLLSNFANLDFVITNKSIMSKTLGTPSESDIEIITPNVALIDENIALNFRLFDIIKEQSQIEMYNASQASGIATKFQRMAQNRGANVIKIGNHPEVIEGSKIYLNLKNSENYKNTINLLYDLLPANVKIFDISEYKYNFSGDIVVLLGKDVIN